MSLKSDSWMPWYPGDYLRDTMHLSYDQHGPYVLLLMHYWVKGQALPDDDGALANIARVPLGIWKRQMRPVLGPFFAIGNGLWWHKRVEAELARSREISGKRREAGGAGNARLAEMKGRKVPEATQMGTQLRSQLGAQLPPQMGAQEWAQVPPQLAVQPQPQPQPSSPAPSPAHPEGGGEAKGDLGFVPDDEDVMRFGAEFQGLVSPWEVPGPMDPAFVATWLAKVHGRREFPPRWRRCLVAEWKARFAPGQVGKGSGSEKFAKSAGVSENVATIERGRKRSQLLRELEEAREQADAVMQASADNGEWRKVVELEKALKALDGE